jgi:7-carboxy-7-deazaguanine synthase
MKIYDIYSSILGEAGQAGYPGVLVRTAGCNLECSYCDTDYARSGGREMTVDEVVAVAVSHGLERVLVTGGEPLLAPETPELCQALMKNDRRVIIETNGSLDIRPIPEGVQRVIDLKTPGSGESKRNDWRNLDYLRPDDEIKFVLTDRNDYLWAKRVMERSRLEYQTVVILSPVREKLDPAELAGWMVEDKLNAKLGLQLHKIIWPGDRRDV